MPIFGGGSGFPSSINRNIRYVHPNGSDNNAGTTWQQPLKYVTTAWTQLYALGGGTISIADGSVIAPPSWPVKGLHINARQSEAGDIAGALLPMPVRLLGYSPGSGQVRGKTNSPTVTLLGGAVAPDSDDQDDPALWLVGPASAWPFYMENIRFQAGTNKCIRHSWDYAVRNFATDGSIVKQDITSAERADGSSVFTVDPYEFEVTHISRTSNVVKVQLTNRVQAAGQQVYIDYSDNSFTPGWFTIVGYATTTSFADSILVNSAGADFTDADPTAEVLGTCLQAKDYMTVYSTDAEWPSTVYRVTSVDEDEITVEDPYGYAPRSATASEVNIGTYAAQDRGSFPYDRWEFDTVAGTSFRDSEPASDRFCAGPTVDIGSTQFFTVRETSFDGYNLPMDEDDDYTVKSRERRAAVLFDGGQGALGTGEWNHHFGERGGFVIHCSQILPNGFPLIRIGQDMDETIKPVPTVDIINAANFSKWLLIGTEIADNGSGVDTIRSDTDPLYYNAITCIDTYGTVSGPANVLSTAPAYAFGTAPYNSIGRTGWYGFDRTVAGRHFSSLRSGGPITAPFNPPGAANPQDSTTWSKTPGGITFTTTGIRDPFGGTGAIRITNNTGTDGSVVFFSNGIGGAPANGDFFAATMWMRTAATNTPKGGSGAFLFQVSDNGQEEIFLQRRAYFPNSEGSAEWCAPVAGGVLSNVSGGTALVIWETEIEDGGSIDVYLPTIHFLPAASNFTEAEAYEWVTHCQPTPYYLTAGLAGTRTNQKFIGHGGLGTDAANAKTVGVGSGQLTLTGSGTVYLPTYDEDGTTIIGWVAQLQATVNP